VRRLCVLNGSFFLLYKFYRLLTYSRKTVLNYTDIFTQLALLLQLKFAVHSVIVHSCNFSPPTHTNYRWKKTTAQCLCI